MQEEEPESSPIIFRRENEAPVENREENAKRVCQILEDSPETDATLITGYSAGAAAVSDVVGSVMMARKMKDLDVKCRRRR